MTMPPAVDTMASLCFFFSFFLPRFLLRRRARGSALRQQSIDSEAESDEAMLRARARMCVCGWRSCVSWFWSETDR